MANQPEAQEKALPLIPQISLFFRWVEELITMGSGYGIVLALVIGAVDLFSDGKFTENNQWIDSVFAWGLAIGISGQLIASAVASRRAFHYNKYLASIGMFLVTMFLAFVEYEAITIYGYHKTFGVSVDASLMHLGISKEFFMDARMGIAVFLAVLSGFSRYQPPVIVKSVEEELAEIERKKQISLAKASARKEQLTAYVSVGKSAVNQAINGDKKQEGLNNETPQVSDENPAGFDEETQGDSNGNGEGIDQENEENTPIDLSKILRQKKWTWREYQAFVWQEYRVHITEKAAKDIVKRVGNREQLRQAGQPFVADRIKLRREAKTNYSSGDSSPKSAAIAVNEQ